ncbi:hypothetical protein F5J12DRAFT_784216 [Pisolithus orientalis]|uniref:uncharacterized protein n=1 Tax=Pisolithus orientalis TaxID=936130 RepID=UPI0022259EDC|nr:uncharacterized protein F5J12DRAFT_784216 [Pisolithus orientalis]KAI6000967.1 hypothetical protein F5J12DRAFT_784216 [Pisolithus orientalis]
MTTWAWGQISNAEAMVQQHATIYRECQKKLIALGAGEDILGNYQELNRADLTDCWEEGLELLTLETRWTQKFFLHKEKFWSGWHMEVLAVGSTGFAYSMKLGKLHIKILMRCVMRKAPYLLVAPDLEVLKLVLYLSKPVKKGEPFTAEFHHTMEPVNLLLLMDHLVTAFNQPANAV